MFLFELKSIYINLGVYALAIMPLITWSLYGVFKGFKKAVWKFVWYFIALMLFLILLTVAADFLLHLNVGFIINSFRDRLPDELKAANNAADMVPGVAKILLDRINVDYSKVDASHLEAFILGIVGFAFKLLYAILFWLIIYPIFRLFVGIIYLIFLRNKKGTRFVPKHRLLGLLFGFLRGVLASLLALTLFTGLLSVAKVTTKLSDANEEIEPVLDKDDTSEVMLLADEDEEDEKSSNESYDKLMALLNESLDYLNSFTESYESNPLVTFVNSIDNKEGEPVFVGYFDTLFSIDYKLNDETTIQIKFREEANIFLNAALALINSKAIKENDLTLLESNTIENVTEHLSKSKFINSLLPLGIDVASNMVGVDIPDKDMEEIYLMDWSKDILSLGKAIGGIIDAGGSKVLNDVLKNGNNDVPSLMKHLNFTPDLKEKVSSNLKDLKILDKGYEIGVSYYFSTDSGKEFIEKYNLNDKTPNGNKDVTYLDQIKQVKISDDISYLMNSVADLTQNKSLWEYISDREKDLPQFTDEEIEDIFLNLSRMGIIEALMDIGVAFGTEYIHENYPDISITTADLFGDGINWSEEMINIGALVKTLEKPQLDLNGLVKSEDKIEFLFNKEYSLTAAFNSPIEALFNMKLINNLSKDALAPLLENLLANQDLGGLKLIFPENLKWKDEALTVIQIADDLKSHLDSRDDLEDTDKLLTAIAKIDIEAIPNSSIMSHTIVNFLCTENEDLSFLDNPYYYEDDVWYGDDGELINILRSLKVLLNQIDVSVLSDMDDFSFEKINTLTLLSDEDLDNIFNSVVIQSTLNKVLDENLDEYDLNGQGINIPESSKEILHIVHSKDNTEEFKKVISDTEFKAVFRAIGQVDIDRLSNEDDLDYLEELKTLNSKAYHKKKIIEDGKEKVVDDLDKPYQEGGVDLKKTEVVLSSNILRATLSDVVVYSDLGLKIHIDNDSIDDENFIKKHSFAELINSIAVFTDATDIKLDEFDSTDNSTLFDKLSKLDDDTLDEVFTSNILRLTFTDQLKEISDENITIIIPANATELMIEVVLTKVDSNINKETNNAKSITKDEYKALFKAIGYLDYDALSGDDQSAAIKSLNKRIDDEDPTSPKKIEKILDSKVLSATISDKVIGIDLGSDLTIVVPVDVTTLELDKDDHEIRVITKVELLALVEGIDNINVDDFDTSKPGNDSISGIKKLNEHSDPLDPTSKKKIQIILESDILHATISDKVITTDAGSDLTIIIPKAVTFLENALVNKVKTVVKVVTKEELIDLVDGMENINLDDFDTSDPNVDSTTGIKKLNDHVDPLDPTSPKKIEVILESDILHATIGNKIVNTDLGTNITLIVPKAVVLVIEDKDSNNVKIIEKDEIEDLVVGMNNINVDDFDTSLAGNDSISGIKKLNEPSEDNPAEKKITVILESEILHATIANKICTTDTGENLTLVVPKSVTYVIQDKDENDVIIVTKIEVNNLVIGINDIELDDFDTSKPGNDSISGIKKLNEVSTSDNTKTKIEVVLNSDILHTTMSDKIVKTDSGSNLTMIIPKSVTSEILDKDDHDVLLITKLEVKHLVQGINHIELDDFDSSIPGNDELSGIKKLNEKVDPLDPTSDKKITVILHSAILSATISHKVVTVDMGNDLTIVVPDSISYDDEKASYVTNVITYHDIILIESDDLEDLVIALNDFDRSQFTGAHDAFDGITYLNAVSDNDPTKKRIEMLTESIIMQSTISYKIVNTEVSDFAIIVPQIIELETVSEDIKKINGDTSYNYSISDAVYPFISKEELVDFTEGITHVDYQNFTANAEATVKDLNNLSDPLDPTSPKKIDVVLESRILQASISKKILGNEISFGSGVNLVIIENQVLKAGFEIDMTLYDISSEITKKERDLGTLSKEMDVLTTNELQKLVYGLNYIDFTKLGGSDMFNTVKEFDANTDPLNPASPRKIDVILESVILYGTISEKVKGMDIDGFELIVPTEVEYLDKLIRNNANKDIVTVEEISKLVRACAAFDSLDDLGNDSNNPTQVMSSLDEYEDKTDLSSHKSYKVSASKIVLASITNRLIELSTGVDPKYTMKTPLEAMDNAYTSTYVLTEEEFKYFVIANNAYSINKSSSGDNAWIKQLIDEPSVSFKAIHDHDGLDSVATIDILYLSKICKNSISYEVTGTVGKYDLVIPKESFYDTELHDYVKYDSITNKDISVLVYNDQNIVDKLEIKNFVNGANQISNLEDMSGSVAKIKVFDEEVEPGIKKIDVIIDSIILHATVSKQVYDLDKDKIYIPELIKADGLYHNLDNSDVKVITKLEISTFVHSITILDPDTFGSGNDILDKKAEIDVILESYIMLGTISNKVKPQLETNANLIYNKYCEDVTVKYYNELDVLITSVSKDEIVALSHAMDVTGSSDFETVNVNFATLSTLSNEDYDKLLTPITFLTTITKQALDYNATLAYLGQDMAFDDNDYLYNPAVIEPGYAVILKKGSNTDNVGIHKFVEYCSTL